MHWMILPLRRYADFSGRSCRTEYWMFQLGLWIAIALVAFIVTVTSGDNGNFGLVAGTFAIIGGIGFLAIIIPSFAVTVRRLHDSDKSGWLILLQFIPYIGGLIIFVFMLLPSTPGENSYGPNPRDPDGGALAEVFQ